MEWNEPHIVAMLRDPARKEQGFTLLVEHFKETLYWQIRRMVLSHDDADDVLQNTLVKAWTGLDSYRGDAALSTWLFRIASNEAINFLTRTRQQQSIDTAEATGVAAQLTADTYFDGDEAEALLQEAITTLPMRQRQVFNLRYFGQMDYAEMSRLLEREKGGLKASYHHAVVKITEFLRRHEK